MVSLTESAKKSQHEDPDMGRLVMRLQVGCNATLTLLGQLLVAL